MNLSKTYSDQEIRLEAEEKVKFLLEGFERIGYISEESIPSKRKSVKEEDKEIERCTAIIIKAAQRFNREAEREIRKISRLVDKSSILTRIDNYSLETAIKFARSWDVYAMKYLTFIPVSCREKIFTEILNSNIYHFLELAKVKQQDLFNQVGTRLNNEFSEIALSLEDLLTIETQPNESMITLFKNYISRISEIRTDSADQQFNYYVEKIKKALEKYHNRITQKNQS